MQVNRRLYRCRHDRRIAGVASGVAEYFGLDVSLVRILWFLSFFVGGFGLLLYIGLWIIVPLEPFSEAELAASAAAGTNPAAGQYWTASHLHRTSGESHWSLWIGLVLLLCGALALIDVVAPGWSASRWFGPLFLIGFGGILVALAIRRQPASATDPTLPAPPAAPAAPTEPSPS
jgi:phage shock protein C